MIRRSWIWFSLALFALVYTCSLTFVYVDPDDATSIAYHVLGRHSSIQQPFELFQFGMDYVLSHLPVDESFVRIAAKLTVAVAAACSFVLLLALSFSFIGDVLPLDKVRIAASLFLAAPEFIYLGLVYTPILVGVTSILSAHLLLRTRILRMHAHRQWNAEYFILVMISALLMAFGGFCRWDLSLYGVLVLADLFFLSENLEAADRGKMWLGLGWAFASAALWLLMVLLSGELESALKDTVEAVVETKGETASGSAPDILRALGGHAMLLTPAFVCAALLGWMSIFRIWRRLAVLILSVLVLAIFWPFRLGPKEYYVFLPFLVVAVVKGLSLIWSQSSHYKHRILAKVSFAIILAVPWIVGVGLSYGDSSWGPGFELQPFHHSHSDGIRNFSIRPAAGAAFPSSDGPRPLMGHACVLIGGEWRTLVQSLSDERISALRYAIDNELPFLSLMHYDGFQVVELAGMGFTTEDPERWGFVDSPVTRRFRSRDGRALMLVRLKLDRLLSEPSIIDRLKSESSSDRFVVWGEPGVMRRLYLFSREALEPLGPCTAILDLRTLAGG